MTCLGVDRDHLESRNPLRQGVCDRCGRPCTESMMERDELFEDECLLQAGETLIGKELVQKFASQAGRRAHDGGVRTHGRDLVEEMREEFLDSLNYVRWEIQRMRNEAEDDHERTAGLWSALQHSLLALQALDRIKTA